MGKKYIIELLDDCQSEFKGIMVFGLAQEKQISVELIPEESLRPYTEPDLEQVRKDAYQRGLSDAWNAARKIWEYDTTTLREIFGEGIMRMDYFMKFTASEAIEKIWQYEQRQEEQIHVGDEVLVTRCADCYWHQNCLYEQHLGLDGFCSKGEPKEEET